MKTRSVKIEEAERRIRQLEQDRNEAYNTVQAHDRELRRIAGLLAGEKAALRKLQAEGK